MSEDEACCMPRRFALFAVVLAAFAAPGAARADTACSFGGPASGFRAMRLALPQGSSFLTMTFTSARPTMLAGDRSSWHFSQGIGVIDESSGELVAWKLLSQGNSPRRAVVEANGMDVARHEITAPDGPFVHQSNGLVPSLPPGTYDVIAFGTDGDARLPNPWWGGEVRVSAAVSCAPLGSGEIVDYDNTDFTGGTQVAAWGAGVAQDVRLSFHTARRLTFGLLDSETQLAGSATLQYSMPGAQDTIENTTVPFVSGAGDYAFDANFSGAFPFVSISGVAVDLP
jgi:hypothetical protein